MQRIPGDAAERPSRRMSTDHRRARVLPGQHHGRRLCVRFDHGPDLGLLAPQPGGPRRRLKQERRRLRVHLRGRREDGLCVRRDRGPVDVRPVVGGQVRLGVLFAGAVLRAGPRDRPAEPHVVSEARRQVLHRRARRETCRLPRGRQESHRGGLLETDV